MGLFCEEKCIFRSSGVRWLLCYLNFGKLYSGNNIVFPCKQ